MAEVQADKTYLRLSDKILEALKLALAQKDVAVSEMLVHVLELVMTRNAGGRDFIERRDFSEEAEAAIDQFDAIKRESKGL
jgi:hypothetical protein